MTPMISPNPQGNPVREALCPPFSRGGTRGSGALGNCPSSHPAWVCGAGICLRSVSLRRNTEPGFSLPPSLHVHTEAVGELSGVQRGGRGLVSGQMPGLMAQRLEQSLL